MRKISGHQTHRGISLVEILLALVIISVGIVAATALAFGSQESIRDAGLSQAALYKVDGGIEQAFAALKGSWGALASSASSTDGVFAKTTLVFDVSECVKQVTSAARWSVPQRSQLSSIITLFSDPEEVRKFGGNCNTTPPAGDWDFPQSFGTGTVSPAGLQANDVDVVQRGSQRIAFVGTAHASAASDDLWVFDVTAANTPTLLGSVNVGDAITGGRGNVNRLVAAGDYVYLALDETDTQFAVVDTNDLSAPLVVATSTLSGVLNSGSAPEAISIAYFDGRVYVGTAETAGPEFHIFDVSTPSAPTELVSAGGAPLELNHNVHAMAVRDTDVFVASSADSCELFMLDVSDPSNITNPCPAPPIPAGNPVFDAPGTEDGTALAVLGSRAYLGRARTDAVGEDELYVIDVSDQANMTVEGSRDLGLSPSTARVNDIAVSGPLVFLATSDSNDEFQVWLLDLPNIIPPSTCDNTFNFPEMATGIDFVDNLGFVSVRSNDALNVIFDDPSCILAP